MSASHRGYGRSTVNGQGAAEAAERPAPPEELTPSQPARPSPCRLGRLPPFSGAWMPVAPGWGSSTAVKSSRGPAGVGDGVPVIVSETGASGRKHCHASPELCVAFFSSVAICEVKWGGRRKKPPSIPLQTAWLPPAAPGDFCVSVKFVT
ncbi:unnamed protein product [Natator depressus]